METQIPEKGLFLKILSPKGILHEFSCDSINLCMAEGEKMKEGSIGIRHGHKNAVIALKEGRCSCREGGRVLFDETIGGGFAVVKDNVVTVIIDSNISC